MQCVEPGCRVKVVNPGSSFWGECGTVKYAHLVGALSVVGVLIDGEEKEFLVPTREFSDNELESLWKD